MNTPMVDNLFHHVITPETWTVNVESWNQEAGEEGTRRRVFLEPLGDLFEDRPELTTKRRWLFSLIDGTPHLDWFLITRRPENVLRLTPGYCPSPDPHSTVQTMTLLRPNVCLGTVVENQEQADERIPHLLQCPANVHFVLCEPLTGSVDLSPFLYRREDVIRRFMEGPMKLNREQAESVTLFPVDWVIVGGDTGDNARPCRLCDRDWETKCTFINVSQSRSAGPMRGGWCALLYQADRQ